MGLLQAEQVDADDKKAHRAQRVTKTKDEGEGGVLGQQFVGVRVRSSCPPQMLASQQCSSRSLNWMTAGLR